MRKSVRNTTYCKQWLKGSYSFLDTYAECPMTENYRYRSLRRETAKNKRGHPHREWTDDIVVWWKSAGTEPLSTGPKQLAEDGEAGIRRQRALSPWLVIMMMTIKTEHKNKLTAFRKLQNRIYFFAFSTEGHFWTYLIKFGIKNCSLFKLTCCCRIDDTDIAGRVSFDDAGPSCKVHIIIMIQTKLTGTNGTS